MQADWDIELPCGDFFSAIAVFLSKCPTHTILCLIELTTFNSNFSRKPIWHLAVECLLFRAEMSKIRLCECPIYFRGQKGLLCEEIGTNSVVLFFVSVRCPPLAYCMLKLISHDDSGNLGKLCIVCGTNAYKAYRLVY